MLPVLLFALLSGCGDDATIQLPAGSGVGGGSGNPAAPGPAPAPVPVISLAIPDTGQTQCSYNPAAWIDDLSCGQTYTVGSTSNPFGEDAHYVGVPAPRAYVGPTQHPTYTADYTVKDAVTGLVWHPCTSGMTFGTGPNNCLTGAPTTGSFTTVQTNCAPLNTANAGAGYAGLTTWRMPTIEELATLSDFSKATVAIDTSIFPDNFNAQYWSADLHVTGPANGWAVNYSVGGSRIVAGVAGVYYTRCVADNTAWEVVFTDNGDGTVTDEGRNLVWKRCAQGQANDPGCAGAPALLLWADAMASCENETLAGGAWRMPNVNELSSLVDKSLNNPPIDLAVFPNTVADSYWTSTTNRSNIPQAWTVFFVTGAHLAQAKSSATKPVRCVRDAP